MGWDFKENTGAPQELIFILPGEGVGGKWAETGWHHQRRANSFTCGLTDHTFYVRKCCGSLKLSRRDRRGARQGWACQEGRGLAGVR